MNEITIGKLAKACEVNIDTVRYYEQMALLSPVKRTEAGYRLYSEVSIQRLNFVRRAQSLGFTLNEIKALLKLSGDKKVDCADIRKVAQEKLFEVDAKIRDLKKIKAGLEELSEVCPGEGKPLSECTILRHCFGE